MSTSTNTQAQQPTIAELVERINKLQEELETFRNKGNNKSQREMTDNDALRILTGDLKGYTHNKAAEELKLSYGQIYSCRLKYTFRHIHQQLEKDPNYKNQWIKK